MESHILGQRLLTPFNCDFGFFFSCNEEGDLVLVLQMQTHKLVICIEYLGPPNTIYYAPVRYIINIWMYIKC